MELVLEHPPRRFWLQTIEDVRTFAAPFNGAPFPCLIWDTRGGRSVDEIQYLCRALIAGNCRYGVCGGVECERWHDGLDAAFLAQGLSNEEEEKRFVLTTWHTDESPDDVAFFFVQNTNFDDLDFTQFLVVQLGSDWAAREALLAALREHATTSDDQGEDEKGEGWSG